MLDEWLYLLQYYAAMPLLICLVVQLLSIHRACANSEPRNKDHLVVLHVSRSRVELQVPLDDFVDCT